RRLRRKLPLLPPKRPLLMLLALGLLVRPTPLLSGLRALPPLLLVVTGLLMLQLLTGPRLPPLTRGAL
ncbi:hypothetical protein BGX27_008912, partial [Mortierella sp. AM989]